MSYCRWSTDHFNCDLYIYEHVAGYWSTHVASYRTRAWRRLLYKLEYLEFDHFLRTREPGPTWRRPIAAVAKRVSTWLLFRLPNLQRRPINGPHDGETFEDLTPLLCALRVIKLREAGYRCPEYVLTRLLEEAAE